MRLTVVGCAGSFPGPDSPASCYLVEAPYEGWTYRLVLDLGNGAFGALQRYTDPYAVDAVGLSHLHADHCVDMCSYYVARKYHPDGPRSRIPVYGPFGTADRLAMAYGLPLDPGMRDEFEFRAWVAGEAGRLGPFAVSVAPACHPVEAYALRLEHEGRSLVYTGDTGPTDAVADLARGADLLLSEATFHDGVDNPPDLHLTGRQAGEYAARGEVRRLVLTHVPPWYDPDEMAAEARSVYSGPLDVARPGAVFEL
ncbi:MBL fold metallo-hydrolase [Actinopolymorpha alba]|uniref:MBL fold metallo-hydrolase n=1 Tax=Actinopolymorpha alba TaxID=533267 RepID=UPI00036514EA|nr:MBL fold metallo-hydrolase [Actinopolymorpha alba]